MQLGLRPQFENYMQPRTPGMFEGMLGGASSMASPWLSSLFREKESSSQSDIGPITDRDKRLLMLLMKYLRSQGSLRGGRP